MYSVLWGTLLLDYETEEESKTSMSPRLCVEVLGVSEWDGHGRANNYMYGFLIVTHTGATYYVSVPTMQERDEWVLQLKRSLECVFANPEVIPFKPSKILSNRPPSVGNSVCPATKNPVSKASAVTCRCCGQGYYSAEHVMESSTVLQISVEEAEKVCLNCKNAQCVIIWLKALNYVHTMALHEGTKSVVQDVRKFKSSFKLRRRLSARLDQAALLQEEGKLTGEEFEELRVVDHSYRRELLYEESLKLKGAVDAFGDDMQTIIDVILNSSLIDKGGRWSQAAIILKVLEVADRAPDIVDFYLPQLLQAHLIIVETRTVEALVKLDLFQQALLVMAQKYPALGLKLAWGLIATVGDYAEKRCSQVQYAACVALLLQLEMVTTGYVSCIADVPTCKQLAGVLVGAMHQQQEVAYEISALFLVRRRLQELTDEEEVDRKIRKGLIDPELMDCDGNLKPGVVIETPSSRAGKQGPVVPCECTCTELLYQLGVGQAGRSRFSDDDSDNADTDEDEDNNGGADRKSARLSKEALLHRYVGFQCFPEQLDFIQRLNTIVESLRFVDRPLRTKCLLAEVAKWNENPLQQLGWDPTTIAGEPFYRIMNIVSSECRVFRTKARAPSMIVCEVLRDDLVPYYLDSLKQSKGAIAASGVVGADPAMSGGIPAGVVTVNSPALNRRAPNPIFVSNVDAHTIDASTRDIQLLQQGGDRLQEERITVLTAAAELEQQQLDAATAAAMAAASAKAGTSNVDHHEGADSSSCRQDSREGLTSHVPNAVYSAAESHSTLKALHLEREKFAATSRNIDNVSELISNFGLAEKAGEPQLKRGEPAHSLTHTPPMVVPLSRGSTGDQQEGGLLKSSSWAASVDSDLSSTAAGASSPGRVANKLAIQRRAGRSVLSSNRLSVAKGISECVRSSSGADDASTGASPAPAVPVLTLTSTATSATHPHLAPSGHVMQMSASGVFSPLPAPDSDHGGPSEGGFDKTEGFGQYEPEHPMDRPSLSPSISQRQSDAAPAVPTTASQVTKKVLSSAQRLLAAGVIDNAEYELLIASDQNFQDETAREEAEIARNRVEDAFGESWEAKRERILGDRLYMFGYPGEDVWPGWDLRSFIAKSNDDLRQEVCCLQLMQLFKEIFEHFGLQNSLYLRPYRIISTGNSTGLVQVLSDAMSLDALKKTEGFTTLSAYFQKTYDTSSERYNTARLNFASSLAAYSLFSYLLLIKDRHNGNLMIDADGHLLHIDFGFLLSIAPGGSFSLESAPFKLTEEMVEVLGGLDSPLFGEFLTAFTKGFIALQSNAENIVSALQILAHNSSFPCFAGKQASLIIEKLRARFRTELSVGDAVKHCLDLITNSYGHYGTRQYDTFQWMTNGIMP